MRTAVPTSPLVASLQYRLGLELEGTPWALHFMAQSWIVSMFLDCPPGIPGLVCPSAGEKANFTDAVARGYITWHAYPFNGEVELLEPSLLPAAFNVRAAVHLKTLRWWPV